MRIFRVLAVLIMGGLFFLVGCGVPSDQATPPPSQAEASPAAPGAAPARAAAAANFTTGNLSVIPEKAKPGERVMVGVTVRNSGTEQGTYNLVVKDHDGTVLGTKDVTLAGGARENVTLHISINKIGTHMVMVDKLYHNLVIQDAVPASTVLDITQPAPVPGTGPATFTLSDLTTPAGIMVMPEDKVTISVTVTNTGGQSGTYTVVLKVQENQTKKEDVKTQDVTLAGGASQKVTFTITAGEVGAYTVLINNLIGTLLVEGH